MRQSIACWLFFFTHIVLLVSWIAVAGSRAVISRKACILSSQTSDSEAPLGDECFRGRCAQWQDDRRAGERAPHAAAAPKNRVAYPSRIPPARSGRHLGRLFDFQRQPQTRRRHQIQHKSRQRTRASAGFVRARCRGAARPWPVVSCSSGGAPTPLPSIDLTNPYLHGRIK